MDVDTTQKLSYMPVCPPQKECLDWAIKPRFKMPTIPMCMETVQKLSYAPPGQFVQDGNCCDPCPPADCCDPCAAAACC